MRKNNQQNDHIRLIAQNFENSSKAGHVTGSTSIPSAWDHVECFIKYIFSMLTCEPEGISQRHRELASKFGTKCGKALPGKRRQNKMEFMQQGQSSIYWARVPKAHCRCNLFIRNQKGQADRLSVVLSPMLSPKRYQRSNPTLHLFGLHTT